MKTKKEKPQKNALIYTYSGITAENYTQGGFYHTVQNPAAQISMSVINTQNASLNVAVQASFDNENWFIISSYQQSPPNNSFFVIFFFTPNSSISYYRVMPQEVGDVYLMQIDEKVS